MTTHRWTRGKTLHRTGREDVSPGETFEATEAELRAFGRYIEPVEPPAEDESESGPVTGPESPLCTETVESTGEECGRERPCQYHSHD